MLYQNENIGGETEIRCNRHMGYHVPAHLHEYTEFLYVVSGRTEVMIEGEMYPVGEKQLILIQPNRIHAYDIEGAHVICAVFSNDLIPLFFRETAGRKLIPVAVDAEQERGRIEALPDADHSDALSISGLLNLICAQVLRDARYGQQTYSDGLLYQQIFTCIAAHYRENLTLRDLAMRFGYNEKYLSHTLHALTGMNFRRLLCHYRISHAKELLLKEKTSIAEIAMKSGFSALNTFNREFREMTGMTPMQYRNEKKRD